MKAKIFKIVKNDLFPLLIVVVSSLIYVMGFEWFLKPIGVYAGGLTGLAQLIREILLLFKVDLSVGLLIFILNVPIVLVGFRFVSKRFAIYSIICIVIQSVLTSGIFPFVDFIVNSGENVDYLLCSIIGAIVTGFACGLALRFGTSTGGIDILAQAATLRDSKVSIGMITMISNVLIGCIGGGILQKNMAIILYTFVRIILTSITVDKIHTAYSLFSLNVISDKSTEITDIILKELNRGCTIINVEGAYTKDHKFDIFMVVSSYEIHQVMDIIKKIDPHVFVVVSPVKRIFGNYKKKTII